MHNPLRRHAPDKTAQNAQVQTNPYKRGWLFGTKNMPSEKEIMEEIPGIRRREKRLDWDSWGVFTCTPLKNYTFHENQTAPAGMRFDFEKRLLGEIETAENEGRTYRVLEIGGFSFLQWVEISEKKGLELSGITLTQDKVAPEMRNVVKIITAAEISVHFQPDYFDMVVSHYGIPSQQMDAVENILYVLKPGGEAILSGQEGFYHLDKNAHAAVYEIMNYDNGDRADYGAWFAHIKKRLDAPIAEMMKMAEDASKPANGLLGWLASFKNKE
ncbi:MAG: class I SAM-dependent methyltransferase [Candidatus Micrarchaeia archaeon]